MKVKSESEREVAQSCPTLSGLIDCSLPGSSIHGIFQARVLEWGAIAFSEKNMYFCFIDYAKGFDCVDNNKLWKIIQEMGIPDHLTCLLRNLYAGQEATVSTNCWNMKQQTGSKSGKKYVKAVYCHLAYLTYMFAPSKKRGLKEIFDFPGGSELKHLPTMWETRVQSLGLEDLLEKRMATHSSILTPSPKKGAQINILCYLPW